MRELRALLYSELLNPHLKMVSYSKVSSSEKSVSRGHAQDRQRPKWFSLKSEDGKDTCADCRCAKGTKCANAQKELDIEVRYKEKFSNRTVENCDRVLGKQVMSAP